MTKGLTALDRGLVIVISATSEDYCIIPPAKSFCVQIMFESASLGYSWHCIVLRLVCLNMAG